MADMAELELMLGVLCEQQLCWEAAHWSLCSAHGCASSITLLLASSSALVMKELLIVGLWEEHCAVCRTFTAFN